MKMLTAHSSRLDTADESKLTTIITTTTTLTTRRKGRKNVVCLYPEREITTDAQFSKTETVNLHWCIVCLYSRVKCLRD